MEIFLTLPAPFAGYVNKHKRKYPGITFAYSDPEENKLGSAGGTVNVLWQEYKKGSLFNKEFKKAKPPATAFSKWLTTNKRIKIGRAHV